MKFSSEITYGLSKEAIMETNPGKRTQNEWAPPPPVKVPPPLPTKPKAERQREEFEATLGNLVERFSNLPPPIFGEPPDIALVEAEKKVKRKLRFSSLWILLSFVPIGGMVAFGGFMFAKQRMTREATATSVVSPEIKVLVKPESSSRKASEGAKGIPQVQPLEDETKDPASAVTPEEKPAVPQTENASKTVLEEKKSNEVEVQRPTTRKSVKPRKAELPRAVRSSKIKDSDKDWEDPYR
jgi:hypothetical protein